MCQRAIQAIREIQRNMLILGGELTPDQLAEMNKAEQVIYKLQKEFERGKIDESDDSN